MNAKMYVREHSPRFIESIINRAVEYDMAFIDYFCGMGGVTEGLERTSENGICISTVIACLNHDANAIESHSMNYPQCLHLEEDVRLASTTVLKYMVSEIRKRSGGTTKICIWFSHECTHFSGARGGSSRDADSRSLPEELERYIVDLQPDMIWIENVREFLSYGPITEKIIYKKKGKKKVANTCVIEYSKKLKSMVPVWVPIPERKGEFYAIWRDMVIGHGFDYEYRIMNCADYGCPTIRKRLFIQFSKPEIPIVWAKPTHAKEPTGNLLPWIPIKECLELDDHGESLFSTEVNAKGLTVNRITSDNTFKRVYEGLLTHIEPELIKQRQQHFLSLYFSSGQTDASIEWPSRCLTTKDRGYLHYVETFKQFIQNYYSSGKPSSSISGPSNALTPRPKVNLATAESSTQMIMKYFNSTKNCAPVTDPSWAITAQDRLRVVSVTKFRAPSAWIMNTSFSNIGTSLNSPCQVILANRKRYYLMNMQYANNGYSVDVPSVTLIASMDKKPNYLISTEDGKIAIEIFKTDLPHAVKIKEWMARWGYTNIYMRELHIKEMLRITTIPEDYKMVGSKTDQKKFIGNAVPSKIVTALIKASYYHNRPLKEKAVA